MINTASIGTCETSGTPFGTVRASVYNPQEFNETTGQWEDVDTNPPLIMVQDSGNDGSPYEPFFITPESAEQLAQQLLELAAQLHAGAEQ